MRLYVAFVYRIAPHARPCECDVNAIVLLTPRMAASVSTMPQPIQRMAQYMAQYMAQHMAQHTAVMARVSAHCRLLYSFKFCDLLAMRRRPNAERNDDGGVITRRPYWPSNRNQGLLRRTDRRRLKITFAAFRRISQ